MEVVHVNWIMNDWAGLWAGRGRSSGLSGIRALPEGGRVVGLRQEGLSCSGQCAQRWTSTHFGSVVGGKPRATDRVDFYVRTIEHMAWTRRRSSEAQA
jgi:hypothetical protein